jgi:ribonucleoside-diphosphate reductase alpha chain
MYTEMESTASAGGTAASGQAPQQDVSLTAPGLMRVIKRNGTVVPFDESKITVAMTNAFFSS